MHLVIGMFVALTVHAQEPQDSEKPTNRHHVPVRLEAGALDRRNVPIRVLLPADRLGAAPEDRIAYPAARLLGAESRTPLPIEVQAELLEGGQIAVSWVHPRLDRNETAELRVVLHWTRQPPSWRDAAGGGEGTRDLLVGAQPVLRYVHAFDPEQRDETYKAYHHLFDLAGSHLLTKGPGGVHPHHRGVFLGWNRTRHGEDAHDFWSCGGGETIRHRKHLDLGPPGNIASAHGAEIEWVTADGRALVAERRTVRAWRLTGGMHLFDFDVELRALRGPVKLNGNAHHAGFQVRLDQGHTTDEEPAIEYLRPATAEDIGNDVWTGCDWVAGRFPMHGGEFVVLHMDAPDNPRPIRYSTRPYGRFGSAFEADLGAEPLRLRYRLVLMDPAVVPADAAACERLYRDYAEPVKVSLIE